MEAKELRIGNLYLNYGIPSIVDADFIGRLASIEKRGKIAIDVSPIPITAEWLERFSFTSNGFFRMKRTGRFLFEIPIDEKGLSVYFCDRVLAKIEYIHQLQNLFYALTGEELTLKTESK